MWGKSNINKVFWKNIYVRIIIYNNNCGINPGTDIYSINDDGNLLDAANLGAIAALKTAKMPKYDSKEEKERGSFT